MLQEAPAAEAWRLLWQPHAGTGAAAGVSASQLLRALYVNPAGPSLPAQLPALAAPLTVALSASWAQLALCLEAGDGCSEREGSRDRLMLGSAVSVHCEDIQASSQLPPWACSLVLSVAAGTNSQSKSWHDACALSTLLRVLHRMLSCLFATCRSRHMQYCPGCGRRPAAPRQGQRPCMHAAPAASPAMPRLPSQRRSCWSQSGWG